MGSPTFYVSFHGLVSSRARALASAAAAATYALDDTSVNELARTYAGLVQEFNNFFGHVLIALHQSFVDGARDLVFQGALEDVGMSLQDFQALLFLPVADLLNLLNLFVVISPSFPSLPSLPSTLTALQDLLSRAAAVEKLAWLEHHCAVKGDPNDRPKSIGANKQASPCTVLEPAGLRVFLREGTVEKRRKDGSGVEYKFWLFNDLFMYGRARAPAVASDDGMNDTAPINAKPTKDLVIHRRIPLAFIKVEVPKEDKDTSVLLRDTSLAKDKPVQLNFNSRYARDGFKREIARLVTELNAQASGVMVSRSPMVDSPAAAGAGAGSGNTSSRVKAVPPKVMPPYPPPLPEPPSVAAADTQLHRPISRINSGPVDLAGQASPPSASPKPKSFAEKFKSLFR